MFLATDSRDSPTGESGQGHGGTRRQQTSARRRGAVKVLLTPRVCRKFGHTSGRPAVRHPEGNLSGGLRHPAAGGQAVDLFHDARRIQTEMPVKIADGAGLAEMFDAKRRGPVAHD